MSEARAVSVSSLFGRVLGSSGIRLIGMPLSAAVGFLNLSVIIGAVGGREYGVVSTVATIAVLLPFADLGVGAAVNTAAARAGTSEAETRRFYATLRAAYGLLLVVAGALIVLMAIFVVTDAWSVVLGRHIDPSNSLMASVALSIFAVGLPASLGARILMGQGLNELAISLQLLAPALSLGCTLLLARGDATPPLAFAISSYAGLTMVGLLLTAISWLILKRRYGAVPASIRAARLAGRTARTRDLLRGSGPMFVIMIGLPLTLETGRLFLAHLGTPVQLAEFALAAQLYAPCWSIAAAASGALWRDFVRARGDAALSLRLWRRSLVLIGGIGAVGAVGLTVAGPTFASILSHGEIQPSWFLFAGFGAVLVAQCLHLPAGVMLTQPRELLWQARWVVVMAIVALGLASVLVPPFGAFGFVFTAAGALFLFQVIPDMIFARRLVEAR